MNRPPLSFANKVCIYAGRRPAYAGCLASQWAHHPLMLLFQFRKAGEDFPHPGKVREKLVWPRQKRRCMGNPQALA